METVFLPAAIVWAALGVGLACFLVRLLGPEPGTEPSGEDRVPGD